MMVLYGLDSGIEISYVLQAARAKEDSLRRPVFSFKKEGTHTNSIGKHTIRKGAVESRHGLREGAADL